jgi:cytosine/adenosine deaminase-related metal-dependent hydrolase
MAWTLTARWILPVDTPALLGGTVTIEGDRIVAVEPRGTRTADVDLGNVAVIPGLVNAHTHLDLSAFTTPIHFDGDFTNWLRAVIAHRRAQAAEQVIAAVRAGLDESLRAGVTLLGDIAGQGLSWDLLVDSPCRAIVFFEMLGLREERAAQQCREASAWLTRTRETANCRRGLSPHAPYSVRSSLFFFPSHQGVPAAIHLCESREEMDLLFSRRGPFIDLLKELGAWDADSLVSGPEDVLRLTRGLVPAIYVHCNYLWPRAPFPANGNVVYCPRTHSHFNHRPHPFRDFLSHGIRVALGTDSRTSNPDLDLLAEARFIHQRYPDFDGATLLRMATLAGAEALGWADETGSLTPGKSADLVAVPLPNCDDADPYRLLLTEDLPGRQVLFRGVWRLLSGAR